MNDELGICPYCHRDIETHGPSDDGDGYWCAEDFVPEDAVLWGHDARQALKDDADEWRMSEAGL